MKKQNFLSSLVVLVLGIGLYSLVTWKWNVVVAAWLAPIFLIRHFRKQPRWYATLPAMVLLFVASYANKAGAWGMDPLLEIAVCSLAALPMVIALLLDRAIASRLPAVWSTLVFPTAFIALDYAMSFLPLGTVFSWSASQFTLDPLIQISTLTGVWGIEFLVLWAAPVVNDGWKNSVDLRRAAGSPWSEKSRLIVRAPILLYTICLLAALLYGGLRLVVDRPTVKTVRVAGVTVAHAHNYWDEIIDQGTSETQVQAYAEEIEKLNNQLFQESETAARSGAQVIFWSEADAFILPGQKEAFLQRAREFAREKQVYFMPAYQVLRNGDTSGFNGLALITPQGEVAYEYEKTRSWYATTSDGILHSIETPYGRIGAVICFDLDFPGLVRQAAGQEVDILLVPAFDTYQTRTYHSEVGMLRGVENGFTVMRMVNEGTSMAADYRGQLLAWQDFFNTPDRILIADLPTQGVKTLYGRLGDWFAWACIVVAVGGLVRAMLRPVAKLQPVGQL